MKINRKLGIAILGLLLIGIGYVSLSGGKSSDSGHDMGSMSHGASSDQMSSSDAMFLQMMIPHHQQAVLMSQLAVKNSSNPEVIALAEKIRDAQGPEIAAMKSWLKVAGLGEDPGHSMGSMKGMLTEDDVASLKKATGKEFDRLFLAGMIAHHDGAVEMLSMIEKTTNPDVKRLGNKILASQSAEIEVMSQMLKAIG